MPPDFEGLFLEIDGLADGDRLVNEMAPPLVVMESDLDGLEGVVDSEGVTLLVLVYDGSFDCERDADWESEVVRVMEL